MLLTLDTVVDEVIRSLETRATEYEYEIVLVNDGSPDRSWEVIERLVEKNSHVLGINLAKNFGQHSAILAGFNYCTGDYVVAMDDDGQTPADELYTLVDKLETGYDVVYAQYDKMRQRFYRRWGSDFTRRMSDYMFDVHGQSFYTGSYFVARRFIIEEIIRYRNCFPYLGGLVLRTTRNIGYVTIKHRERMQGKSGYTLRRLVSLWVNGFTAFSVKPLEISAYIGVTMAILAFIYAILIVIRRLFIPSLAAVIPYGWSSLTAIVLFIGGLVLVNMGLMGEYLGRIYMCINNSPQYVIKSVISQKEPETEKPRKD